MQRIKMKRSGVAAAFRRYAGGVEEKQAYGKTVGFWKIRGLTPIFQTPAR